MFIGQIKTLRRQDIYVFFKLIPQVLNVISIHGHADFQRNFVSPKIPKNIKMIIKNSNFMFIGENITLGSQNTKRKKRKNKCIQKNTFEKPLNFRSPRILKNGQNANKEIKLHVYRREYNTQELEYES